MQSVKSCLQLIIYAKNLWFYHYILICIFPNVLMKSGSGKMSSQNFQFPTAKMCRPQYLPFKKMLCVLGLSPSSSTLEASSKGALISFLKYYLNSSMHHSALPCVSRISPCRDHVSRLIMAAGSKLLDCDRGLRSTLLHSGGCRSFGVTFQVSGTIEKQPRFSRLQNQVSRGFFFFSQWSFIETFPFNTETIGTQ